VRTLATGVLGGALLVLGQTLTLVHVRPLSDYWYGIVWTGFVLAADALLERLTGASLLKDRPRDLVLMTAASAGGWWLFELANVVLLDSWSYSPSPDVPVWAQRLRSTFFFATLVPASWEATLLALAVKRTFFLGRAARNPARKSSAASPIAGARQLSFVAIAVGVGCGLVATAFPVISLPLSLIALGLVVDGVNLLRGRPSLVAHLRSGRLALPCAICLANIAAGFLGEMWNYHASPKWTYRVPYADTIRLFEMPLPGYLGYAALALDLFAVYQFVRPNAWRSKAPLPAEHPLSLAGLS
jgi:hypothetical protein